MVAPHDFQARFPEPEELGLLQECFDRILKSRSLDRVGAYANAVATALFTAYERGITEKGQLIRLADLTMRAERQRPAKDGSLVHVEVSACPNAFRSKARQSASPAFGLKW